MIERRSFLFSLAAAGALPAVRSAARAGDSPPIDAALVLSGGGARGAYEAGFIGELAAVAQVPDGSPLPPYGLVCGTSIGALNGWFVATAQYRKLRELWYGISGQDIIALKPQYAALRDPESGLFDRAAAAVSLIELARNQSGILQSKPAYEWIVRNVDPRAPLAMPLVWAVTNLSHQRPEYFFVDPEIRSYERREQIARALRISLGPQTIVREATPEILHRAIFASVAIPIAFDPVMMPGPSGTIDAYCDGGVASNSPVGIAHALAGAADVILLSPPFEPGDPYGDAVEVAFGAFATVQRKLLEVEMRNTYFQSVGKRALRRLEPGELARVTRGNDLLARYVESIPETELRYARPAQALPLGVVAFDDASGIYDAYRRGWEDAARGFTPYDWETFVL
ncbi:MAG: patatin-like phospholipase family protein [Candidatus Eremiobacteraeota bacterium]|nr:patatin-like phospholipase family protein [Candidatus Eremiobacteraeota bacterium]